MKITGKLVIIERPVINQNPSGIQLSDADLKAQETELIKKWTRLKVHSVGTSVTEVKPGDEVLITPKQLSYLDIVEIDGKDCFVAQESHIIGIY